MTADGAFDSVSAGSTTWTTGRIMAKDFPSPDMVRLRMLVEDRHRHWPGQHYLIRLRAPDDYTAQRSYSIASDDSDPLVEFLVERLPNGEVSEFLAEVAEVGDILEMRGPIGRWFRWDTYTPSICLVGGTGVVPAVAMTRAARRLGREDLLRVVAVGRSPEEMPYADELAQAGATIAFTRHATSARPPGPPTLGGGHPAPRRRTACLRLRLLPVRPVRGSPLDRVRSQPNDNPRRAVRCHRLSHNATTMRPVTDHHAPHELTIPEQHQGGE